MDSQKKEIIWVLQLKEVLGWNFLNSKDIYKHQIQLKFQDQVLCKDIVVIQWVR
jgi:hypothetical protein